MKHNCISYLVLLICAAGSAGAQSPQGVRGWYDVGATLMDDAELEAFFAEPLSGNKVKFDPGFRAAIGLGRDLAPYVAIEAEGAFHYNSLRSVSGATSANGDLYQFPVFGNVVLQFPNRTGLVPVIGGGVGAIYSILDANNIALGGSQLDSSEETWSFAYQGYAGLMYHFRTDMALGITYHYVRSDGPNWDDHAGNDVKLNRLVSHTFTLTYTFRF